MSRGDRITRYELQARKLSRQLVDVERLTIYLWNTVRENDRVSESNMPYLRKQVHDILETLGWESMRR